MYLSVKKIYGCYERLWPSLPFGDNKERELYLHLFLARESPKSDIYAPMSYIVITERDDNPNLYVVGQEHKKVLALDILSMKQRI